MSSVREFDSEVARLAKLRSYAVLDTDSETAFDDIVAAAARLLNVPISLVSLIDENRQWFKARVGLDVPETPREISFCTHAIEGDEVYIIGDASKHPLFHNNPLVTGFPNIRFYAGAPLVTPEQLRIGTLCVIDTRPREGLGTDQVTALTMLSKLAVRELEYRPVREQFSLMSQFTNGIVVLTQATSLEGIAKSSINIVGGLVKAKGVAVDIYGTEISTGTTAEHHYQVPLITEDSGTIGSISVSRPVEFTDMEKAVLTDFARIVTSKITAVRSIERSRDDALSLAAQLAQAQKSEALGRLTGGFAHDFNNMLGVMLGNLDMLRDQHPSHAPSIHLLTQIEKAGHTAAELIQRLLAFARRQPLRPLPTDLGALVTGLRTMLTRSMAGITIHVEVERVPLAIVDPSQFESAVVNLVVNAKDAMPEGGGITIRVEPSHKTSNDAVGAPSNKYVMVSVSDTGTGMDPDTLSRACEPFFTTKGVGRGTGLGLSMVYGFVKQSNGLIEINSALNKGTTIRLFFPCATEGEAAPKQTVVDKAVGGTGSILLVEDEELMREVTAAQLRSLGYAVTEAEDGEAALSIIAGDTHFDLLITDVVMKGGINGPEVAKCAAELRPDLPVIFVSGYARISDGDAPELDVSKVLAKPFRKAQLAAAVHGALNKSAT